MLSTDHRDFATSFHQTTGRENLVTPDDVIDYESLVAEYNETLTTVLRGFRPAVSFLETWVPDENSTKSLVNLVEAAEIGGRQQIALLVGPDTVRQLDMPRLLQMLSTIGTAVVEPENGGILLRVSNLGRKSA